jgi:hypothetical protein
MTLRLKILLSILAALIFFALGRYTTPAITVKTTEKKTDEIKDINTDKKEIITEVKKPDGTITTVTQIDTVQSTVDKKDIDTVSKTVTKASPKINISALGVTNIHNPTQLTYGLSANKEVLGPITAGAFVLANGTIGISIGLDF